MMHTGAGAPMMSYKMQPLGCDHPGKAADLAQPLKRLLYAQVAAKS
jgi:hypothetical protein